MGPELGGSEGMRLGSTTLAALAAVVFLLASCAREGPPRVDEDLLFEDDFSDPGSGWPTRRDEDAIVEYSDERLRIEAGAAGAQTTTEAMEGLADLADVRVETDVFWSEEERTAFAGLLCRAAGGRGYSLSIAGDGTFSILRHDGADRFRLKYGRSTVIRGGPARNNLRADCVGESLVLWVNASRVAEATDATYPSGAVGMSGGSGGAVIRPAEATRSEIHFDDFRARRGRPEPSPEEPSPSPFGSVVLTDNFGDPASGWLGGETRIESEERTLAYAEGRLMVTIGAPGAFGVFDSAEVTDARRVRMLNLADVSIEVEATLVDFGGDPGDAYLGVKCRSDGTDYYSFLIFGDGQYAIVKAGEQGRRLEFLGGGFDPVIRTGRGSANRLRADCIEDRLTIHVNGKRLHRTVDADYQAGRVGMLAGTGGAPPMEAAFADLRVRARR